MGIVLVTDCLPISYNTSSRIHLLFPLTKESVSINNCGERNYGGGGMIETVESFEKLM